MGAREITIVVSLALHGLVAVIALNAAHEKKKHAATTISMAEEKKKKAEAKKPPPPKPPPVVDKPKPPPPKPAAVTAPVPVTAPETAPAPAAASAPLSTDIAMGNDTGMDLGTGRTQPGETKPGTTGTVNKPKPPPGAVKTPIHVDAPPPATSPDGQCTEPPGKPEPVTKSDIEYTEEARAAGIEGRLVLKVTVDAQGNVTNVQVVSGVDGALDAAAIATVKTWRFKPAYACGKPVAGGQYTIARRFVLGD